MMEFDMRLLAIPLFAASLAFPATAMAGNYYSHNACQTKAASSMTTSCQSGVTVYRGQPVQYNYAAMQRVSHDQKMAVQASQLEAQLRKQKRKLKSQKKMIAELEERIDGLEEKPRRRGRYNRVYYGNSRFFGRNGFVGNGNFSGASPRARRGRGGRKH